MNSHKNARLTHEGRKLLIERIAVIELVSAAQAAGVTSRTARKWRERFAQQGLPGLLDRSSRPAATRNSIETKLAQCIEQLRRGRMPIRRIASVVGRSAATISRFVARLGLSSLKALQPTAAPIRYERAVSGELLHMDTKKLGRVVRAGHRVTGDPRDSVAGAGWEFAHVAIDDHSRVSFVQMHPDERKTSAVAFLQAAVAHYATLGVRVKQLITDNGLHTVPESSSRPVKLWVSNTPSPGPTGRRPTARPNGSSKLVCANGLTPESGPPVTSARLGCLASWPTTTPADPIPL
jgi:transposase